MRDGSDAVSDWPLLNALLNCASRRHLGVAPSRRRRRHGLLAACRRGDRLRRHTARRRSVSSGCCGTTRPLASCATPMPGYEGPRLRAATASTCPPYSVESARSPDPVRPRTPSGAVEERRRCHARGGDLAARRRTGRLRLASEPGAGERRRPVLELRGLRSRAAGVAGQHGTADRSSAAAGADGRGWRPSASPARRQYRRRYSTVRSLDLNVMTRRGRCDARILPAARGGDHPGRNSPDWTLLLLDAASADVVFGRVSRRLMWNDAILLSGAGRGAPAAAPGEFHRVEIWRCTATSAAPSALRGDSRPC